MKINWKQVYEGWRNNLVPPKKLRMLIGQVSKDRLMICNVCEFNSANTNKKYIRPDKHCVLCGCTIAAKVTCLSCDCANVPPKWEAVLTAEQEEELNINSEL